MQYSSLDIICRSALMNMGLSLHYYVQGLKYGSDILREISMDDLLLINSVELNVNSHHSVTLPDGCIDDIQLFIKNGQYLKPMVKTDGFNRSFNYDSNGVPTDFPLQKYGSDAYFNGLPFNQWYYGYWDRSDYNLYGFRSDGRPFTYEVIKERNEIQLNQDLGSSTVVLQYITDGRSLTAATQIPTYAEKTIETYIEMNLSPKREQPYKLQLHNNARRILRGRMNDLTADDIKNIFRKNNNATAKN